MFSLRTTPRRLAWFCLAGALTIGLSLGWSQEPNPPAPQPPLMPPAENEPLPPFMPPAGDPPPLVPKDLNEQLLQRLLKNDSEEQVNAFLQDMMKSMVGENGQGNLMETRKQLLDLFQEQIDLLKQIRPPQKKRETPPLSPLAEANQFRTGLQLSLVPIDKAIDLKIPQDMGLVIHKIVPDSPADRAGFKANDILLYLAGQKVPNHFLKFYGDIAFRLEKNKSYDAVVLRNGIRTEIKGLVLDVEIVRPATLTPDRIATGVIIRVPPAGSPKFKDYRPGIRTIRSPSGVTTIISPPRK